MTLSDSPRSDDGKHVKLFSTSWSLHGLFPFLLVERVCPFLVRTFGIGPVDLHLRST